MSHQKAPRSPSPMTGPKINMPSKREEVDLSCSFPSGSSITHSPTLAMAMVGVATCLCPVLCLCCALSSHPRGRGGWRTHRGAPMGCLEEVGCTTGRSFHDTMMAWAVSAVVLLASCFLTPSEAFFSPGSTVRFVGREVRNMGPEKVSCTHAHLRRTRNG